MNISRVLILCTILIVLSVNAQAQCDYPTFQLIKEPVGLFPNEVDGYKFFGDGKLSSLRLGVSTREDVAKIFGEPKKISFNEEAYEYDSDWSMIIGYFDQKSTMATTTFNSKSESKSRTLFPVPEYIGKMATVRLFAKRKIPFNQTPDPNKFINQPTRDLFNYKMYRDPYGLKYKVFESFIDKKQESQFSHSKGDIIEIQYRIECLIERKIFIEKK